MRLVPSDFRMAWFVESANDELYGLKPAAAPEFPSKLGNQPPLAFYTPDKPGPLQPSDRAKRVIELLKREDKDIDGIDEIAMEMGRRLDSLNEISTWGYNWIIPPGIGQTAKHYREDRSTENEGDDSNDAQMHNNDEGNNPMNDQNANQDVTGDDTAILVENVYARPVQNLGNDVTRFSASSIDESSAYEIGDIAIHEQSDDDEDGYEESGVHSNRVDRDLDAEMTHHELLDEDDFSFSESESEGQGQGQGQGPNQNQLGTNFNNHSIYVPENLQSSFQEEDNNSNANNYLRYQHLRSNESVDDGQYFMAHEDYQGDHSIVETVNKLMGQSSGQRIVSILGETGVSVLHEMPESSIITTPSTFHSNNGANQSTGQTSASNAGNANANNNNNNNTNNDDEDHNSSDSDMIIE